VKTVIGVFVCSATLALTGCGEGGVTPKIDAATGLTTPGNVTSGGRLVYVLEDVSCDMEEAREKTNRLRALLVGAHAAALDSGTLEVGVVRSLASQNIEFKPKMFIPSGKTGRFRVASVLRQRDDAVASLRKFVNRTSGAQGCSSDLLGALSAVRRQHDVEVQRLGHNVRADIVFVTNGLIVDRAPGIVLTKTPIEKPGVFAKTLETIRKRFAEPDLHGFTVWLVGTGWDRNIKTERGPAVQKLWEEILKPTGAVVKTPMETADSLPPHLSAQSK